MRPVSSVWNHFIVDTLGKKKSATCRYCSKKYLFPNATKMSRHVNKCIKRPLSLTFADSIENMEYEIIGSVPPLPDSESDDATSLSMYTANLSNVAVSISDIESSTSSACSIPQAKKNNFNNMKTFIDSITDIEREKLDAAFARAIYSSNCPLALTDNPYWKDFLRLIRPAYRIPTRNDFSNNLLENEYMRVMQTQKETIKNSEFVSIVSDGWSNIRNEGIISYVITTPCPVFYKSIETNHNKHSGEYIAKELSSVINEIQSEKVLAVVTDNASNMKSAWKIMKSSYPNIHTIGCSAHVLNLLLNDISKIATFNLVITRSKDVIKYVKHKQALLSIFTAKQKLKRGTAASTLKLPADTRWSGVLIMFESLLNGKESLQEAILQEDLNIDRDIRQLVLDNDLFWASISSLSRVLQPICNGIALIESDRAVLSDVKNVFFNIIDSFDGLVTTPLQTNEETEFKTAVESRQAMCCQPIHLAAHLLDPRYQKNELNSEDYESAVNFISSFSSGESAAKLVANLAEFKAHEGIFSSEALWKSSQYVTPLTWWKGLLKNQSLAAIAIKLFNIPPSSAACERIFSAFSKTHTVLRNRLTNDRVSKLIAIRSSLTIQSKVLEALDVDYDMD